MTWRRRRAGIAGDHGRRTGAEGTQRGRHVTNVWTSSAPTLYARKVGAPPSDSDWAAAIFAAATSRTWMKLRALGAVLKDARSLAAGQGRAEKGSDTGIRRVLGILGP